MKQLYVCDIQNLAPKVSIYFLGLPWTTVNSYYMHRPIRLGHSYPHTDFASGVLAIYHSAKGEMLEMALNGSFSMLTTCNPLRTQPIFIRFSNDFSH